ncbi:hypothetical protein T265_11544 [Opisthorchis viverrini]|uniref:Uncharacterized protein n=1 Tax=Opisthorchis viverrini TaxID=6198 RepID=A0A074ZX61_OPIVI|nr:hypothetical protein T265_11544 [Opisthorchis viverrini]KER19764.1 hypothetical protein T265_11544 [Opisthorchis viverrini]
MREMITYLGVVISLGNQAYCDAHVPNMDTTALLPRLNDDNEPPCTIDVHQNILRPHWSHWSRFPRRS